MFKIYKSAVNDKIIDELILAHEKFKKSSLSFFRAQGTLGFEKPILDKYGNQVNSVQNPHLLGIASNFSNLVKKIIYSDGVYKSLVNYTGSNFLTHYQSMFFDKSTSTKIHQDSWYLDTIPAGKLVGVWIALEDINVNAGSFYVYSDYIDKKLNPSEIDIIVKNKNNFYAQKGDILIWNSFAVHGADMPLNDELTRKSLTAHFYPKGLSIQEPPIKRSFSIYNHLNPISTSHPNINSATTISPIFYHILCILLANLGKLSNLFTRDHTANKENSHIRKINK